MIIYVKSGNKKAALNTLTPLTVNAGVIQLWAISAITPDTLEGLFSSSPFLLDIPDNSAAIAALNAIVGELSQSLEDTQDALNDAEEQQAYFENYAQDLQNENSTLRSTNINQQTTITELGFHIAYLDGQVSSLGSDITTTFTGLSNNSFSLSFWGKPSTIVNHEIVRLQVVANTIVLYAVQGLKYNNTTRATIDNNQWAFWQITRGSGVIKTYKNGAAIGNDLMTSGAASDIVLKRRKDVLISNVRFTIGTIAALSPPTRE